VTVLDVVLSPRARAFVKTVARPARDLLVHELLRLGTPEGFLALREVLGQPPWLEGTIDPFIVQCRMLAPAEAIRNGATPPALLVAEIARKRRLRTIGLGLIREAEDPGRS
jgi:hypothetical protein